MRRLRESPNSWTNVVPRLGVFVNRRALARLVAVLTLASAGLMVGAVAAPVPSAGADQAITTSGPLTSIGVTSDLSCSVNEVGDNSGEFYGENACATEISVAGTTYGPAAIPAGNSPGGFIPVSQTGVTGSGTNADPYVVVTVVDVASTGLTITETDTYVVGDDSYRTDVLVSNTTGSPIDAVVYRGGDCYLHAGDTGFGSVGSPSGAVACVAPDPITATPTSQVLQWAPLTAGSDYFEGGYGSLWANMSSGQPLPDTCDCAVNEDNAGGLSWSVTVPADGSVTESHLTTVTPQVAPTLTLGTEYDTGVGGACVVDCPILAGTDAPWSGTMTNTGPFPLDNVNAYFFPGATPSGTPTWSNPSSEQGGDCTPAIYGIYVCDVGSMQPGDSVTVNATVPTNGLPPQTLSDYFVAESNGTVGAPAPVANLEIDGLQFYLSAPSSVVEGDPLTIQGSITNTSATQTIHSITTSGSIDIGSFSSIAAPGCNISNNIPAGTGGSFTCPTPFDLAPGVSLPSAATVDTAGLAGQTIDGSVVANSADIGGASYSATVSAVATNALGVGQVIAPVSPSVTAGYDAVWTVPIVNNSAETLTGVAALLHANANGSTPLGFDALLMPNGCLPAAGNSEACTLANIPAHTTVYLNVYVPTTGLSNGTTITGDIAVTAMGATDVSGTLGSVTTIAPCGAACVQVVASPGVPTPSGPVPTSPSAPPQQTVTLPATQAGSTPEPIAVTLSTITPSASLPLSDRKLCPTAPGQTQCSGKISSVVADFSKFNDPAHPIKVKIVTDWGTTVPAGRILMEKKTGGDPLFLLKCVSLNAARQYNTPCLASETTSGTTNKTTTDTILMTGLDVHFARRVSTGGTIIKVPSAPTALSITGGALKATLKWKAPTATNGAGVTSYVVTVLAGGVVKKTVTYPSPLLTETVTGLVNGTVYTFKVAAGNVAGTGAATAASAVVKIGAPLAPTAVTATAGHTSVTLHWTAPANNGTAAVNGYVITPYVSGVPKPAHAYNTTATTETITGLTTGTSYTFKVAAKNTIGTGPQSTPTPAIKPT
jgi:hypothetical protein